MPQYTAKKIQRSDGSTIEMPPDANFTPVNPGSVDIDLESSGTVQQFSIGTRLSDVWGRVFRYVEYGGTIAQASMVQGEAPDAVHDDLDLDTAAVAGDTSLKVASPASGTADFIADEYAAGWVYSELLVSGIAYPIKSHLLWDISTSDVLTVDLWVPVRTAIVVDCDLSFVKSKYKEVIISAVTPTASLIGSNAANGAVDGDFGWVQSVGPAKVLGAGTLIIGDAVIGITTAGAVAPIADTDSQEPQLGQVMNVGPTTTWSLIDLHLE